MSKAAEVLAGMRGDEERKQALADTAHMVGGDWPAWPMWPGRFDHAKEQAHDPCFVAIALFLKELHESGKNRFTGSLITGVEIPGVGNVGERRLRELVVMEVLRTVTYEGGAYQYARTGFTRSWFELVLAEAGR